jgi:hypothetical protein
LQAIEDVTQAYQQFRSALHELPEEWQQEILKDIGKLTESCTIGAHGTKTDLLRPANAVRELLAHHSGGLQAGEIIKALSGKIQTTSDNEYKLLYSTLAVLKKNNKIVRDNDGRYRLPSRH